MGEQAHLLHVCPLVTGWPFRVFKASDLGQELHGCPPGRGLHRSRQPSGPPGSAAVLTGSPTYRLREQWGLTNTLPYHFSRLAVCWFFRVSALSWLVFGTHWELQKLGLEEEVEQSEGQQQQQQQQKVKEHLPPRVSFLACTEGRTLDTIIS